MKTDQTFLGLDIGSVSIKAAVVRRQTLIASQILPSGGTYRETARKVMEAVLKDSGMDENQITGTLVTGMGAERVPFDAPVVSDISCQAAGCHGLFPSARTLIDIGGQFTKVARITPKGQIADFLISEKCATGSGRFLQVISRILQVRFEEIGPLSLTALNPVKFSTNCAVFAESETVSRIAEGAKPADILAGVHRAMASKVAMLVKRVKMEPDVVVTGGGGVDEGLADAIGQSLGIEVVVPATPRITAAFGAACLAEKRSI